MTKAHQSARRKAAARRARQRRQRQLAILLAVIGGGVLIVGALILLSQSSASAVSVENIGDYSSLPQGIEEDGSPYIGQPDAPLTLVEYSDFACPHCATFSETVHQLIGTYVADGSLKIVYKAMSFVNPQTSPTAAAAGLCAADQSMFWEMHDALFGLQRTQGSGAFTTGNLIELAGQIGLDTDSFGDCLKGGDKRAAVLSIAAEAQRLGVHSTPTIMFNGQFLEPGVPPPGYLEGLIRDALS